MWWRLCRGNSRCEENGWVSEGVGGRYEVEKGELESEGLACVLESVTKRKESLTRRGVCRKLVDETHGELGGDGGGVGVSTRGDIRDVGVATLSAVAGGEGNCGNATSDSCVPESNLSSVACTLSLQESLRFPYVAPIVPESVKRKGPRLSPKLGPETKRSTRVQLVNRGTT